MKFHDRLKKMDKDAMKAYNSRLILSNIIRHQSISKSELARLTKLSVVSITRITDNYLQDNLLQLVDSETQGTLGRPSKDLRLNDEVVRALALYIEREESFIGVIDSTGTLLKIRKLTVHVADFSVDDFLLFLRDELERFLSDYPELHVLPIINCVLPGVVDSETGVVRFSSALHWRNVPLIEKLETLMPRFEFMIENDIKAVAIAEMYFGVSKSYTDSVVLNIGDGIGAAVIINHELHRGRHNTAGEIGHIVTNPGGRLCECGQFGCLQTDIAEWAIVREASGIQPDITIEEVFQAYEDGKDWALRLISKVVSGISLAINMVAMAYAPEVVILYGNLVYRYPILRRLIQERYRDYINEYAKDGFELAFSDYDNLGHLVGAAIQAIIAYFNSI